MWIPGNQSLYPKSNFGSERRQSSSPSLNCCLLEVVFKSNGSLRQVFICDNGHTMMEIINAISDEYIMKHRGAMSGLGMVQRWVASSNLLPFHLWTNMFPGNHWFVDQGETSQATGHRQSVTGKTSQAKHHRRNVTGETSQAKRHRRNVTGETSQAIPPPHGKN